MKDETILRLAAIEGGVVIIVTACLTGLNSTLHILAGLLLGFGIKISAKGILKILKK